MEVAVDINVVCPECGSVMVRHSDFIACGYSGCPNFGTCYEIPKIQIKPMETSRYLSDRDCGCPQCRSYWDKK